MSRIVPQHADSDEEIANCFDVMHELRPHLSREDFLPAIRKLQNEGYRLAYIKDGNTVVCVAGYRISHNLFMGKNLYVDDLVTTESGRSKTYGAVILSYLKSLAKDNNCEYFHLDSGTQRDQAHKFYFKQGLTIASFHFSEKL